MADADVRPFGGESVRDFYDRVARLVDDLADGPDGDVVAVCHGGTIRVAGAYLGGVAPEDMEWRAIDNTQIATFEMAGRVRQRGRGRGRARHLPGEGSAMIETKLTLPHRESKPRSTGLTMMIDGGLPLGVLRDVLEGAGTFIDFVKFGWGTALVTGQLDEKIACLREHEVSYYFGGTLFEKHVVQDRFDDFRALCLGGGLPVRRGVQRDHRRCRTRRRRATSASWPMTSPSISEVGFKDATRSENLPPNQWIDYIHEDLEAGAVLVTLEARESGRSGICRPNGEVRFGLIEELLTSGLPTDSLLFEAPNTGLQSYFLKRIGPDANLGNIALDRRHRRSRRSASGSAPTRCLEFG